MRNSLRWLVDIIAKYNIYYSFKHDMANKRCYVELLFMIKKYIWNNLGLLMK